MAEITDVETVGEEPQSIDTDQTGSGESVITATIVHESGSEEVSEFVRIEERNVELGQIRVWYDDRTNYVDYYQATVTEVSP